MNPWNIWFTVLPFALAALLFFMAGEPLGGALVAGLGLCVYLLAAELSQA